jgi:hypothetical protein
MQQEIRRNEVLVRKQAEQEYMDSEQKKKNDIKRNQMDYANYLSNQSKFRQRLDQSEGNIEKTAYPGGVDPV